jgi:hypothetical protein
MKSSFRWWVAIPVALLALLVLGGWVRGQYYLDKLFVNRESHWLEFGSGDGIWFQSSPWVGASSPAQGVQVGSYPRDNLFRLLKGTRLTHSQIGAGSTRYGFTVQSSRHVDGSGIGTRHRYYEVPYWFLVAVMAAPSAWVGWTTWRHVRFRRLPCRKTLAVTPPESCEKDASVAD